MTSVDRARALMGAGFLGVEEAARHLGADGMKGELPGLQNIPFDEAILSSLSRSHLLFPGSPLSILDLRRVTGGPFSHSGKEDWYDAMPFALEKVEPRWHLVRAGIVPESTDKTFEEQQRLLREEEVPRACEVVYMAVLYYLARGIRLFDHGVYVRCRDVVSKYGNINNGGVMVGNFEPSGLDIGCIWFDYRLFFVGVAASRKIPVSS